MGKFATNYIIKIQVCIYTSIHPKPEKNKIKPNQNKNTSSQAFIFVCLLLERQPPILLFDAKKFQPATDASNEQLQ